MFETMVAAAANSAGMTTPRRLPQGSSTGPAYGEEEAPPQLSSSRSLMSAVSVSDPNDRNLDRASLVAASDVVQALFGVEVGPCWGDFFCTHSRIRGRLYAVTSGVLFYSNLLGFERRLCLQFRDIVSIALYRTTSIRIDIADDGSETYIFKSFHNRVHVIQLLMGLKRLADKKKSGQLTKLGALRSQSEGHEAGSRMQREEEQLEEERQFQERLEVRSPRSRMHLSSSSSSFQLPYTPTPPNRRRAVSDSVVRLFGVQEDLQEFAGDDPFLTMHSNGSDMKEAWETASREISSLEETGIESLRLACSLDKFYRLFLQNDAACSFDRYQRENVGDSGVSMTPWVDEGERHYDCAISVCSRILTFTHPIKSAMGIGPTEAKTTRRQLMRRYQHYGMTVENKTVVEGIPAADTFSVHDFWIIKAEGTDHVVLSVNFASRFTKRTLFKNLIERSILKETKQWFIGYSKMVQEALRSGEEVVPEPKPMVPPQSRIEGAYLTLLQKSLRSLVPLMVLGLILLLLVLAVLVLQLMYMHEAVSMLRDETTSLRQENRKILLELERGYQCLA